MPAHLSPRPLHQLPEFLLLGVDGVAHPDGGVLAVLYVRARRADARLAVLAVESQGLA